MDKTHTELVTVSVVSHGQGNLVSQLLRDLESCTLIAQIIVTQNIEEPEISCPDSLKAKIRKLKNSKPLGFGANHNQAFKFCETSFFVVLNPDIRIPRDVFPELIFSVDDSSVGLIAPVVWNLSGQREDNARHFPTISRLLKKALGISNGAIMVASNMVCDVDWVAGMFLLFRRDAFEVIGGFNEKYFLYYEDVDVCARLWLRDRRVVLHSGVSVIHDARRSSRSNLRYLQWHVRSMARYLFTYIGQSIRVRGNK